MQFSSEKDGRKRGANYDVVVDNNDKNLMKNSFTKEGVIIAVQEEEDEEENDDDVKVPLNKDDNHYDDDEKVQYKQLNNKSLEISNDNNNTNNNNDNTKKRRIDNDTDNFLIEEAEGQEQYATNKGRQDKFIPLEIQNGGTAAGGEGTYSALSSAASSPRYQPQDLSNNNNNNENDDNNNIQSHDHEQYPQHYHKQNQQHQLDSNQSCSKSETSIHSSCASSTTSSPYPVPPAPPSTPISYNEKNFHDISTPLPKNNKDEQQHQQSYPYESHTTTTSSMTTTTYHSGTTETYDQSSSSSSKQRDSSSGGGGKAKVEDDTDMLEDFSKWKVGQRYELIRILGRGSYGEVAQARDKYSEALSRNGEEKFVAIKKITTAFEQEVDSLRLFREIHILRKLRGHECIIQLLDVVAPDSESIDDLHDLYLVFECKFVVYTDIFRRHSSI